jgi:hypothetical protein
MENETVVQRLNDFSEFQKNSNIFRRIRINKMMDELYWQYENNIIDYIKLSMIMHVEVF